MPPDQELKQTKKSRLSWLVPNTNRKKFILFACVFALIGGAIFVYASFAQSPDCDEAHDPKRCFVTNVYSDTYMPPDTNGYQEMSWKVNFEKEPAQGQAFFASTGFRYSDKSTKDVDKQARGYMGLIKADTGEKRVIFTIWNAFEAYPSEGESCKTPGSFKTFGNSICEIVTYEPPLAASVRIKFDWKENTKYTLSIKRKTLTPVAAAIMSGARTLLDGQTVTFEPGTYYVGEIHDPVTNEKRSIGQIRVNDQVTGMTDAHDEYKVNNFIEFVGSPNLIKQCSDIQPVKVIFSDVQGITADQQRVADYNFRPDAIKYQPKRHCQANSNGSVNGDGFKHEVGGFAVSSFNEHEKSHPIANSGLDVSNILFKKVSAQSQIRYVGCETIRYAPSQHITGSVQPCSTLNGAISAGAVLTPTPPSPPPVVVPLCTNGYVKQPELLCDDGGWRQSYQGSVAGHLFNIWRSPDGQCGTPDVPGLYPFRQGYWYPIDCNSITLLQQWEQARAINDIAKKANAIQDVAPLSKPQTPIDTDSVYRSFAAKKGNLHTWDNWEKPSGGQFLGTPNFFIPDPHGLYNVNTRKDYNFFGGIWGYIDGQFVAASNMSVYGKNVGPDQAFLFGPYENPGGSVAKATAGGKKVMKVCWTIKDLLAAETGNQQKSTVRLRVTSNGGGYNFTNQDVYNLGNTNFKQYCQDNIRISDPNVRNLEYPVIYRSGSVAISRIDRTIYWPQGRYTINLPSYGQFADKDPSISQSGSSSTPKVSNQCFGTPPQSGFVKGCKLTSSTNIGVTSSVFAARKDRGNKELCVKARLPNLGFSKKLYAYIYADQQQSPAKVLTLRLKGPLNILGQTNYCIDTQLKSFERVVLSTNITDPHEPAIVYSLTVE